MRVELTVDLRPAGPAPKPKPIVDPEAMAEAQRSKREDRFLRRVALAHVIEARIAAGEFADLADAARRCRVSRARLSMIVNWRGNETALGQAGGLEGKTQPDAVREILRPSPADFKPPAPPRTASPPLRGVEGEGEPAGEPPITAGGFQ